MTQHDMADEEAESDDRIAVIGMAGRFPGARDLDELWTLLSQAQEGTTFFTEEELHAAGVPVAESRRPGYVKASPILDDIRGFDAGFFHYTPREAELLDPQQRLFLEVVWQALEDAGWDGKSLKDSTGLFAGSGLSHYLYFNLRDRFTFSERGFESLIGNDKDYLASRVAYKLDLGGPAINVQTACSTSLAAVHLACQSLLGFESDMAIAGGITLRLPEKIGYQAQQGGLFSPDGHCRPFDAQAQGTIFGSGVGVVVLKRLEDAERDGDTVRAVILGSAVNNDGSRKVGYTAPGEDGQVRLVGEVLELADVDPASIGYIETHGTGTALGDPIEVAALNRVFRDVPAGDTCALGSIKSNFGHLECAAGIAGFIKAVLALEHAQIPASLHFESANPYIDFAGGPFYVNTQLRDWPLNDGTRRAGVSSFGIGGTNAHVLLEQAPERDEDAPVDEGPYLLPISARSESSLRRLVEEHRRGLEDAGSVAAWCRAAALRRAHHARRVAVVGQDRDELIQGLRAFENGEPLQGVAHGRGPETGTGGEVGEPKIVFVFPGQGSQWPAMGRRLMHSEPVFADAMKACDRAVRAHTGWSVIDTLNGAGQSERFDDVDVVQPLIFSMSVALVELWRSWGIEPDGVIGHSQGEISAAYVSGALSLEDAARVVCVRSRLVRGIDGRGSMAVIDISAEKAELLLAPYAGKVTVAASNSPRSTVLSGEVHDLEAAGEALMAEGIDYRRVRVNYSSHSTAVDPLLPELVQNLGSLSAQAPELRWFSTVDGTGPRVRALRRRLLGCATSGAGCASPKRWQWLGTRASTSFWRSAPIP